MTQKKIWIIVGVVVVALIAIKVIATLSRRAPETVDPTLMSEQVLPIENVAPVSNVSSTPASTISTEATTTDSTLTTVAMPATQLSTPAAPTVMDIQTALKNAGFDPGPVDGKSGKRTKAAVAEFQRMNGLNIDGKVGSRTWAKLSKFLVASASQ